MNRAASFGRFRIHEHIHSSGIAVPKSMGLRRFDNLVQVSPVNRHVDVTSQPAGNRVDFIDVYVGGESPDDPVLDARFRKSFRQPACHFEELIHFVLEESVNQHCSFSISEQNTRREINTSENGYFPTAKKPMRGLLRRGAFIFWISPTTCCFRRWKSSNTMVNSPA